MSAYQIETMYEVYEITDDRGHRGRFVGVSPTPEGAKEMAQGFGWFGCDVEKVPVLMLDDGTGFVLRHELPVQIGVNIIKLNETLRASALARLREAVASLSPAERAQIDYNEAKL